ncbi:MAG: DinB family protein [Vicinamibacteria bacterium]
MADSPLLKELHQEWLALRERLAAEDSGPKAARGPFPVSPLALYAQLEELLFSWRELRTQPLEALQQRYVNGGWTLKDLLGHLASWAAEFRREVETVAAGGAFDYSIPYALSVMGPSEWNATAAETQRPKTLETVVAQFETETRRLQDLVLELSDEILYGPATFPLAPSGDPALPWKGNVAQIVLGKCEHDRYHLGWILKWLEQIGEMP